mmetsp:Transcript_17919/g.31437  ORF Transcript_17919/g.31437 Transcript_17919/m.31437 type:complete len:143 (+) Transcript_17919:39-467(+)
MMALIPWPQLSLVMLRVLEWCNTACWHQSCTRIAVLDISWLEWLVLNIFGLGTFCLLWSSILAWLRDSAKPADKMRFYELSIEASSEPQEKEKDHEATGVVVILSSSIAHAEGAGDIAYCYEDFMHGELEEVDLKAVSAETN